MKASNGATSMFHHLSFQKSASEIVERATAKAAKTRAKIEERQARVADLRKEHGIDDAALIQLLTAARHAQKRQDAQMSYNYTSNAVGGGKKGMGEEKTIGAGVVNHLLTESDHIEAERESVERLDLISRNLKPIARFGTDTGASIPPADFALNYEELEFLGF